MSYLSYLSYLSYPILRFRSSVPGTPLSPTPAPAPRLLTAPGPAGSSPLFFAFGFDVRIE